MYYIVIEYKLRFITITGSIPLLVNY